MSSIYLMHGGRQLIRVFKIWLNGDKWVILLSKGGGGFWIICIKHLRVKYSFKTNAGIEHVLWLSDIKP